MPHQGVFNRKRSQTSRMRLQLNSGFGRNGHAKKGIRVHQVRALRPRNQEKPRLAEILQPSLPVERLERTAPAPAWRWTVSEVITLPTFHFGSGNSCTYCGEPATSRDHVIAVSYQTIRKGARFENNGPWCWSCSQCNSSLSNRYFDTFKDRCEWIHWRHEVQAKPINWHEWELKPIGHTLQSGIREEMQKRRRARCRADFYGSRDFYLNIESLTWEIGSLKGEGLGSKFIAAYFSSMLHDIIISLYDRI